MTALTEKWNKAQRSWRQRRQVRGLLTAAQAHGRTDAPCLITNLSQMGDVVLSAGIVAALRERFPTVPLLFAGVRQWRNVLEDDPLCDGVLDVQSLWEVRALARAGLFQTVYVLDIPMPTLLRYFDGVPSVFRYAPPTTGDWFTQGRNLMSLYEANAGLPDGTAQPRVWRNPADEAHADVLWAQHNLNRSSGPIVALHTHSSMAAKNWPPERFADLIHRRAAYGTRWIVVGGPGEGAVLDGLPHVVNLAGQLTVKQTAAIIARCTLFVGPDSGLAYVAEAVGTPGLVILGATVPETSGPRTDEFTFVRAPNACIPACHRVCTRQPLCITVLDVATVESALEQVLSLRNVKGEQCASR